jgi:hypothetical protein
MDDGIEREDNNSNRQSTNERTSTTDHRYVKSRIWFEEIKNRTLIFLFCFISDDRCQESFNSDQR